MKYKIRIKGYMDTKWADRFEGFSISYEGENITIMLGEIVDDAALHGVLKKIRDLGITLLSINIQDE